MAKTSDVQRAIDRLQAEIDERFAAITHLRAVQVKRPQRKPKATLSDDSLRELVNLGK